MYSQVFVYESQICMYTYLNALLLQVSVHRVPFCQYFHTFKMMHFVSYSLINEHLYLGLLIFIVPEGVYSNYMQGVLF